MTSSLFNYRYIQKSLRAIGGASTASDLKIPENVTQDLPSLDEEEIEFFPTHSSLARDWKDKSHHQKSKSDTWRKEKSEKKEKKKKKKKEHRKLKQNLVPHSGQVDVGSKSPAFDYVTWCSVYSSLVRLKRTRKYEPQAGVVSALVAQHFRSKGFNTDINNAVENTVLLAMSLSQCTTISQFSLTMLMYFKTLYTQSVTEVACKYLSGVIGTEMSPQSGIVGMDDSYPTWLSDLKELSSTWTLALHAEGFNKIGKILSLCVALGMCKVCDIVPTVNGLELFSLPLVSKNTSVIGVVDAVFDLVIHFAEGGYMCFKTGSIKPLLYGSIDHQTFSDAFHKCMRCNTLHACGNLEKEGLDDNAYDKLLDNTIEKAERLLMGCSTGFEKSIFNRQIEKLHLWKSDFNEIRMSGGLRIAPYAIGLFGDTAVGKTTLCPLLTAFILKSNGFDASDNCTISIKEDDKYMSQMKSYINCIVMDDIGNTKADFVQDPPTRRIIELINNNKCYANMAEAEKKGKVSIAPKLVLMTKNVKDAGAAVYSNAPASIARRDTITVTVRVKERYARNGMLDRELVNQYYPNGTPFIPNLWEFWVEQAYPTPGAIGAQSNVAWAPVVFEGKSLEGIEIHELFNYLRVATAEHFATQRMIVKNNENIAEKMVICEHCKMPEHFELCSFCQTPSSVEEAITSDYNADSENTTLSSLEPQLGREITFKWLQLYRAKPLLENVGTGTDLSEYCTVTAKSIGLLPFTIGNYAFMKCSRLVDMFVNSSGSKAVGVIKILEKGMTKLLIARCTELEDSPYFRWTTWVPAWLYETPGFQEIVLQTAWTDIRNNVLSQQRLAQFEAIAIFVVTAAAYSKGPRYVRPAAVIGGICALSRPCLRIVQAVQMEKIKLIEEISERRDAVAPLAKRVRDNHLTWILGTSAAMAAIYAAIKSYQRMKGVYELQGNLAPTSVEDIIARDKEISPWKHVVPELPTPPVKNDGVGFAELFRMCTNNLTSMSFILHEKLHHCNAFFPKSNVAIIPKHMWLANSIKATFIRRVNCVGSQFSAVLERKFSEDIPGTDMSLVWVPSGGDWRDISRYLPASTLVKTPARLVYKGRDGTMIKSECVLIPGKISPKGVAPYDGATYTLEWDSFAGLCMAPLITDSVTPCIAGFHLCGNGKHGALGTLSKTLFDAAFVALSQKKVVVLSHSDTPHDTSQFGIQFFQDSVQVHPKSAVRHLPAEISPVCKVYGVVGNQSTAYSTVVTSPISDAVERHCGIEQRWGPPKFRSNYPWQASLQFSSQPTLGLPAEDLIYAVDSYMSRLNTNSFFMAGVAKCTPLSRIDTVAGQDGVRFLDAMKANTSIGFPFSGPKSTILRDVVDDQHNCPKDVDPMFWREFDRVMGMYDEGNRSTQIFKACLKDEPTKLDKDKVRVFQAAPLVLQLGVRMYFLPLARMLSLFPLASECAVGINAESPEWEQMDNYVNYFGQHRILAGDYSKYDLRMPAQLMFAAFRILIDLARVGKYTDVDLKRMIGLATEICYAYTAYNGDLIKFFGSNPSGQNLTVYINSIVNSLILRCTFHSIYPRACFNKNVCAITYGDDFKGSVSADVTKFNHISMAEYLETYGMKLTMPDKTSKPTPFLHSDDCDFLKRRTHYNRDLACKIGILEDSSIFKSLHCVMKSRFATPREVAAMNIDGALRSWFYHGRSKFESMQIQMQRVAYDTEISHMCLMLYVDYDTLVAAWLETHGKNRVVPSQSVGK